MPTNREIPHHGRAPVSASEVDGDALEKQLARLSMLAHLERIQMELELSRVPYSPPTPTPTGHGAACDAGPASAAGRGKQRPRGLPTRIPPGVTEPMKTANWGQIAVLLDCITDLHDESRLPSPAPGPASPPPPPGLRTGIDGSGTGDGYATGESGESGGEQHAADDDVHIWAGASESPAFRARLDKLKARRGCWGEYDDGDDGDDGDGDAGDANDGDNEDDGNGDDGGEDNANDDDNDDDADADYDASDEGGSLRFITASGQSPPRLPGGARDGDVGVEESRRGNAAGGARPTAASSSSSSGRLAAGGGSKGKGPAAAGRPPAVSLPAALPSRASAAPGVPETAAAARAPTVGPFEEGIATGGVQNAPSHGAAAPPSRGCSDANSPSRSGAASRPGSSENNNSHKLARSRRSGTANRSSSSIQNSSGQLARDNRSHHSETTPPVPTEREGSSATPRLSAAVLTLEGLQGYSASSSRASSRSGRRRSELLYELPASAAPTGSPQLPPHVCSGAAAGCAGTRPSLPRPCGGTGPRSRQQRQQQQQQQQQQHQQQHEQQQEHERDEAGDIWQDARVGELVWDERELRFRFPHLELGGSPTANAAGHWHRDGRAMAGARGPCPHTSGPALLLGHCRRRDHNPPPARAPATGSGPQSSRTAINSTSGQGPPLLDPVVPQLLPGNAPQPAGRSKPTPTELVPPRRALLVDGGGDEDGGGSEGGGGGGGGGEDQEVSSSGDSDDLGQRVYFNPLFGQWLPFPTVVPEEEEQAVPGLRARIRGKVLQLTDRLRRPCALCCRERRPPIRKRHIGRPTEPRRPVYEPIVL